jgi:hypothetical protein
VRLDLDPGNLITAFVGLAFIVSGAYAYYHMGEFIGAAREVTATVVEVQHESINRKGRMHPVVRFEVEGGRQVVAQADEHHNVQPGDTVHILYDPAKPQVIEITTRQRAQNRRLLISTLSIALGAFVCLMGIGVIRIPG